MAVDSRLNSIRLKMQELQKADAGCTLFGAANHKYLLNEPIAESEIQSFEQNAGIRLPGDYRAYFNTVSNGGGGPFYGLYDLKTAIRESLYYYFGDDDLDAADWKTKIEIASEGELKEYFTPFPITTAEVKEVMRINESYEDDTWKTIPLPEKLTGFLLLCEYGCGGYYLLVVNGEQAGTVWFFQTEEYLNPCYTKGKQWDFYDFMEWWADDGIMQIKDPQARYKNDVNDPLAKKELIYDQQEMTAMPDEIFACKNLLKLQFSRNKITALPAELFELKQLRILNIYMNLFEEIPAASGELNELRVLNLSYCSQLKMLPAEIGKLKNLKKLELSYCTHLLQLPEEIGALTNLEELRCYGAGLKFLPQSIKNLHKLKVLNLYCDDLDLASVCKIISACEKIEMLVLKESNQLPKEINLLQNVQSLVLLKNYGIDDPYNLPATLAETKIEKLYIDEANCLLPENLGEMQSLTEIAINTNQFNHLPPGIRSLKNLKKFRCEALNEKIPVEKQKAIQELLPDVKFQWW